MSLGSAVVRKDNGYAGSGQKAFQMCVLYVIFFVSVARGEQNLNLRHPLDRIRFDSASGVLVTFRCFVQIFRYLKLYTSEQGR